MLQTRPTVLIIDADVVMHGHLCQIGGDAGFDVVAAPTGRCGLDIAARGTAAIAAVVLELRLPDVRGEEILKRLRRADRNLPVIVATSCGSIAGACDAIRDGGFDYLAKPVSVHQLAGSLRRAFVERRRRPAAVRA